MSPSLPQVLFVCVGNSCRSQMAEGWARRLGSGVLEARSAGTQPQEIHPRAVESMSRAGVDISAQDSKELTPDLIHGSQLIVTLCQEAQDACPAMGGSSLVWHRPIKDPSRTVGPPEDLSTAFDICRDEVQTLVEEVVDKVSLWSQGRAA